MVEIVETLKVGLPNNYKVVEIKIDEGGLAKIEDEIRNNPDALSALEEGWKLKNAAIQAGETGSPEIPASYKVLFDLMTEHNPNYPGTIGSKIIFEMQNRFFQK